MTRSLIIFEHKKGFFISTENQILILLTGIVFLFSYLNSTQYFDFGNWLILILVIWVLYVAGCMISNFFLHECKNGEYKGKLELQLDSIIINKTKYELNDIKKISIRSNDYEGQFVNTSFEFTRKLSNGLNNELVLKLTDGNEVQCNFFQTKGQRIKHFKELLTNYHLKGKISWLHLLSVLEMEDYDEIQIFKKKLKERE